MEIRAAVVRQPGGPFLQENLTLAAPQPDEVVVRIVATGLCHSDITAMHFHFPPPPPVVLGHEGAGIVDSVGANVTHVVPGDHVVLSFNSCGECVNCKAGHVAYCENFFPRNLKGCRSDGSDTLHGANGRVGGCFFGQSSFANYALAHKRNTVKVRKDAPLELARKLGATHVIDASKEDPVARLTGMGGMNYVIEAAGIPSVIAQAVQTTRSRGICGILGVVKPDATLTVNVLQAFSGRTIMGITEGDADPHVFIPYLVDKFMAGELPLDLLIRFYAFEEINKAVADSESGVTVKPILRMA